MDADALQDGAHFGTPHVALLRIQPGVATKPNWIEEEYLRRARGSLEVLDETARERHFQKAAEARWQQLANDIRADVEEFSRIAEPAQFSQPSDVELRVERSPLVLVVTADLEDHNIHYDYQSDQQRAAAPEGGILSMRSSRYGRVDLYSADERLTDEEARRMLLEPVLFPTPELI